MKLTVSTAALILALVSAQVGAMPAPQTTHVGHTYEQDHTYHRGGLSGGRPAHGPMPDEDEDGSHLERRINYIQHPSANWKWWQKQGTNKMLAGSPDVGDIDVKNDAIGERLGWKRDESAVDEESHLERRINYIQHPSANWKWWQKQGTNKMLAGSPDVGDIDVKNDAIGERLGWKRDDLESETVLRGKGGHGAQDKFISVPVLKED